GGSVGPLAFGAAAATAGYPVAWLAAATGMLLAAGLMLLGRRLLHAHRAQLAAPATRKPSPLRTAPPAAPPRRRSARSPLPAAAPRARRSARSPLRALAGCAPSAPPFSRPPRPQARAAAGRPAAGLGRNRAPLLPL